MRVQMSWLRGNDCIPRATGLQFATWRFVGNGLFVGEGDDRIVTGGTERGINRAG